MAFRFETANERWSWHKNSDLPYATEQKRLQYEYDSLGDLWKTGIGAQMLQAIEEKFPESKATQDDGSLLQGVDNLLYGVPHPAGYWSDGKNTYYYEGDEKHYGEIAKFVKDWLDQNGWKTDEQTWHNGEHDEFPYRRKMPGEIYGI